MTMFLNDRELRLDVTPAQVRVVHAPDEILISIEALIMLCNPASPHAVYSRGLLFVGSEKYEVFDYDPVSLALVARKVTELPETEYVHGPVPTPAH